MTIDAKPASAPPPRSALVGVVCALICVVIWAVNYPAMKVAFRELQPLAYTGWRFIIATVVLVGMGLARRERLLPPPGGRKLAVVLALSGVGIYQWFYSWGVAHTSGFAAALLNSVAPLLSLLLVAVLGWEKLTRFAVAGSIVAYAGVALFVYSARGGALGGLLGNLLCLVSAACWAVYSVNTSRIQGTMSTGTAHTATFIGGTAVILPYCLPSMLQQDYGKVHALSWTILVLSALLPLVVAFRAWTAAIRILGIQRATSYGFLIPVVAGVTSAAWTGERFSAGKIVAAVVVLAGLALTRVGRKAAVISAPVGEG
ncbi:MAG: DMT family transporter [Thermoanaerobaculia bacterium]